MIEVTDGLSAFRLETEVRARGDGSAVAVYCISPGVRWFVVPADSEMRPDPVPPSGPRRVSVAEGWLGRPIWQPQKRRGGQKMAWWWPGLGRMLRAALRGSRWGRR